MENETEIDNLKYMDFDSTFRNRNDYPNPFDFVIPYNQINQGSIANSFLDPVLESAPYTGSSTLRPGQLFTQTSIDTENITLDSKDSIITNYYTGSTLQIGDDFRDIIYYDGLTKIATVSVPFPSLPPSGTLYYTRKVATYFNSNVSIYRKNDAFGTVDQLNLLTAAPSPIKDFYKGSYIRFTNGPHVGDIALITSYQPFGNISTFSQTALSPGSSNSIPTSGTMSLNFSPFLTGYLYSITITLESFETTSPYRSLYIQVIDTSSSNLLVSQTFPVYNTGGISSQTFVMTSFAMLYSNKKYTLVLYDTTPNGNNYGYINIYGVSSSSFETTNTQTFPQMSVSVLYGNTGVAWSQPQLTQSSLLPPNVIVGINFPTTGTGPSILTTMTINIKSYESVDVGRTLRVSVLNGSGLSGSLVYTTDVIIPNTDPASDYTFLIGGTITSGNTYTITLEDITLGGTTTGYIYIYGIPADTNYITYNLSTYPKITVVGINRNSLSQPSAPGFNQTLPNSEWGYLQRTLTTGTLSTISTDISTFDNSSTSGGSRNIQLNVRNGSGISGSIIYQNTYNIFNGLSQIGNVISPPSSLIVSATPRFGYSVSVSANGNIMAVGATLENTAGAVYVYIKINGKWYFQQKIMGSNPGSNTFGSSIKISGDGSTIAVGGPAYNSNQGAVWVFVNNGFNFWTEQSFIVGSGSAVGNLQGFSVSLSFDGNYLVFGGYNYSTTGAVWIYTRSGTSWSFQTRLSNGVNFGYSVSLNYSGNVLVVGAPLTSTNGRAYVYTRSGVLWTLNSSLAPVSPIGVPFFGSQVSITDGELSSVSSYISYVAVSGINENTNTGAVFIYFYQGSGIWNFQNKIVGYQSGTLTNGFFGRSLSIKYVDTNLMLAVGSSGLTTNTGASWIFTNNLNTTTVFTASRSTNQLIVTSITSGIIQIGQVISATGATAGTQIISFVSGTLGGVGTYLVNNSQTLASSTFTSNWRQVSRLLGTPSATNQFQGFSLSVSDTKTLIVGGYGYTSNIGAVWEFNADVNSVSKGNINGLYSFNVSNLNLGNSQTTKLIGSGYTGSPSQGEASIGISGDGNTMCVCGPADNTIGAVWVFIRSNNIWSQQGNKLVPYNMIGFSFFYYNSDISQDGNTIVFGKYGDNSSIGACWVYTRYSISPSFVGSISGNVLTVSLIVAGNIEVGASLIGAGISPGTEIVSFVSGTVGGVGVYQVSISQTVGTTNISSIWKNEQKLVGTGNVGASTQGTVAINSSGTLVAMGGYSDNGSIGACWTFNKDYPCVFNGYISGTTLNVVSIISGNIRVGQILNSNYGMSVAQIITDTGGGGGVGTYTINISQTFASIGTPLQIFSNWSQMGSKIVPTDYIGNANIGYDVALKGDGTILAIDGYTDNSGAGAIWIYNRNNCSFVGSIGGTTLTVTSIISGTLKVGQVIYSDNILTSATQIIAFGSGSGGTGTYVINNSQSVSSRNMFTNWYRTQKLTNSDSPIDTTNYLVPVVLSRDGNYLLSTSYSNTYGSRPVVYVFKLNTTTNQYVRSYYRIYPSDYSGTGFQGVSLALNSDGSIMTIGQSSNGSSAGGVWVFSRTNETWNQNGNVIVGTGAIGSARQGSSTSINDTGDIFASGGPGDNSNVGAVWIFSTTNLPPLITNNNLYTYTLNDTSSSSTGLTTLYGINNDSYYITYGGTIYPKSFFVTSNSGTNFIYQQLNQAATGLITTPYGFRVIPTASGFISNITLRFFNGAFGCSLLVSIIDGEGLNGYVINRKSVFIPYTGGVYSIVNIYSSNTLDTYMSASNIYTIRIDIIGGSINVSGTTPSSNYVVYSSSVYPRVEITGFSANDSAVQPTNLTSTDVISAFNPMGYQFIIANSCSTLVVSFMYSSSGAKTIAYQIRSGSGLTGSVLFTGTFNVSLSSTRTVFTSSTLSTPLSPGTYTLLLWDVTSVNPINSVLYIYGINSLGSGYTYYNTNTIPNMVITADTQQSSSNVLYQPFITSVYTTLSDTTPYGFRFVPSSNSFLSRIVITLTSFNSIDTTRSLRVIVRDGAGMAGTILYSGVETITNVLDINDYTINVSPFYISGGNEYTLTLTDETVGGLLNGAITIYGITSTPQYVSYNISMYPKLLIGVLSPNVAYTQSSNPVITDIFSPTIEKGFKFEPNFAGNLEGMSILLSSFSSTGQRNFDVKIYSGAGLGGITIYTGTMTINNMLTTSFLPLSLSPPFNIIDNKVDYTISFVDTTPGGTLTGNTRFFGITSTATYQSYNTTVYPTLQMGVPSFIITISPPQALDGFLANNLDNVEFNSQAYENANSLKHAILPFTRSNYYRIKIQSITIPRKVLDVSFGGDVDRYPYFYVSIYNKGNRGAVRSMFSNNPRAPYALFKIPTRQTKYDTAKSFYVFKECSNEQIIHFRPDQDIGITYYLPDGSIISTSEDDTTSPYPPNPLLQTSILLSIKFIDLNQVLFN